MDGQEDSAGDTVTVGEDERSFAAVAEGDAIFRYEEGRKAVDPLTEGAALRTLLTPPLSDSCAAKLGGRWDTCLRTWAQLEPLDDGAIGARVLAVVGELEAPHLRAGGIRERLQGGVDAACFGLVTLLSNMASDMDKQSGEEKKQREGKEGA